MFLQLDELEQYGCRPLVRVCGIPKTNRWVTESFTGRVHPHYKKVGGSTTEHPVEDSAGQYFELIWTDKIWDKLIQETNTYAEHE